MSDGQGSFPNVVIQHFLQIDVIVVIQTKRVPDNVGHFHPGVDEDDFYNLKPGDREEDDTCAVLDVKILRSKYAKDDPRVNRQNQRLAIDQRKRIVLIEGDSVELGVELVQVTNDVFLLLQLAALTFWVV